MQLFIGTKLVKARPMNRADFNTYRGWELPADENGEDAGMLVEYLDGGKTNHPAHEGYISWSPMDVFVNAYRSIDGMTFGQAIEAMKSGYRVARKGWNGKGMFLFIAHDIEFVTKANLGPIVDEAGDVLPSIVMYTATKEFVVGWLASQTDMLSDDWNIVA